MAVDKTIKRASKGVSLLSKVEFIVGPGIICKKNCKIQNATSLTIIGARVLIQIRI